MKTYVIYDSLKCRYITTQSPKGLLNHQTIEFYSNDAKECVDYIDKERESSKVFVVFTNGDGDHSISVEDKGSGCWKINVYGGWKFVVEYKNKDDAVSYVRSQKTYVK